jgi:hypothetical protein
MTASPRAAQEPIPYRHFVQQQHQERRRRRRHGPVKKKKKERKSQVRFNPSQTHPYELIWEVKNQPTKTWLLRYVNLGEESQKTWILVGADEDEAISETQFLSGFVCLKAVLEGTVIIVRVARTPSLRMSDVWPEQVHDEAVQVKVLALPLQDYPNGALVVAFTLAAPESNRHEVEQLLCAVLATKMPSQHDLLTFCYRCWTQARTFTSSDESTSKIDASTESDGSNSTTMNVIEDN